MPELKPPCLDCSKTYLKGARGLCHGCYCRRRDAGQELPPKMVRLPQGCVVDRCGGLVTARELCSKHYARFRKYGDPLERVEIQGDDWSRFWSKVSEAGALECWLWTDCCDKDGYGKFRIGNAHKRAHRVAWEFLRGEIPPHPVTGELLVLDHECRNPACVNPYHLDPVTSKVNTQRGVGTRDLTCMKGHVRTPENTGVTPGRGHRYCKDCKREYLRAKRASARIPGQPLHGNARKRECPRGHLLSEPNLVPSQLKAGGGRGCLACSRANAAKQRARNRGEESFDIQSASDSHYAKIMSPVA